MPVAKTDPRCGKNESAREGCSSGRTASMIKARFKGDKAGVATDMTLRHPLNLLEIYKTGVCGGPVFGLSASVCAFQTLAAAPALAWQQPGPALDF